MSEQGTGVAKEIWLHMLAEGGYSSIGDISRSLNFQDKRIDRVITQMWERGFCLKTSDPRRKHGVGFGVTASCKVPQNVLLKEILAATQPASAG